MRELRELSALVLILIVPQAPGRYRLRSDRLSGQGHGRRASVLFGSGSKGAREQAGFIPGSGEHRS